MKKVHRIPLFSFPVYLISDNPYFNAPRTSSGTSPPPFATISAMKFVILEISSVKG